LGAELLEAVDRILARIREFPSMYPVVYKGLRRALVRRFPYAVDCRQQGDSIRVLACLHQRRDPRVARLRA
jgi:plasmid stabilization system protein ParE